MQEKKEKDADALIQVGALAATPGNAVRFLTDYMGETGIFGLGILNIIWYARSQIALARSMKRQGLSVRFSTDKRAGGRLNEN